MLIFLVTCCQTVIIFTSHSACTHPELPTVLTTAQTTAPAVPTTTAAPASTGATTEQVTEAATTQPTTQAVTTSGQVTEGVTTVLPPDVCPAGQTLVLYTRNSHDAEKQFQIIFNNVDETSTLLAPSPGGGLLKDGPVLLKIELFPNARQSNIIVELQVLGADSVTFHYEMSDMTQSQSTTVSQSFRTVYLISMNLFKNHQLLQTLQSVNTSLSFCR